MKKYVNGVYVEMSQEEIEEIKAASQQEEIRQTTQLEITQEDVLSMLLEIVEINLPNGTKANSNDVIGTTIDIPFKVGYRIERQGTSYVYVKDDNAVGTQENPIIYHDNVELINNAFYIKDNKLCVYIQGEFVLW